MDSPVGTLLLIATPKGIVRIAFETENRDDVLGEVAEHSRRGSSRRRAASIRCGAELDRYFAGKLRDFDVPIDWTLTGNFARRVLRRTAKIPYGHVASYGEVAHRRGDAAGARAVGNALGSNPIPVVVPCHRVIRTGGAIGGYGGGLPRKQLAPRARDRLRRSLPAGRGLGPVEQPDEVLGTGDSLPAAREEVLRDHPVVRERGHRDRPLIESPRDLDLMGGGFVAHDNTAGRRTAPAVVASRGRHSHRKDLQ